MRTLRVGGIFFVVCLMAVLRAGAVSEDVTIPDFVVRERVEQARNKLPLQTVIERENARRLKAYERVEKIRRLPLKQIPVWQASDRSDVTLDRLSSQSSSPTLPPTIVPRTHLIRLGVAAIAVLVLAALFMRNRRMAQLVQNDG